MASIQPRPCTSTCDLPRQGEPLRHIEGLAVRADRPDHRRRRLDQGCEAGLAGKVRALVHVAQRNVARDADGAEGRGPVEARVDRPHRDPGAGPVAAGGAHLALRRKTVRRDASISRNDVRPRDGRQRRDPPKHGRARRRAEERVEGGRPPHPAPVRVEHPGADPTGVLDERGHLAGWPARALAVLPGRPVPGGHRPSPFTGAIAASPRIRRDEFYSRPKRSARPGQAAGW